MIQASEARGKAGEPRLLLCGFGRFPGVEVNPAEATVVRLAAQAWAPSGAGADYLILPTT